MKANAKHAETSIYTLKIIPHKRGVVRSFPLPLKYVKYASIFLVSSLLLFLGVFSYSLYGTVTTKSNLKELEELRKVNVTQHAQLSELSKKANDLQDEMDKLSMAENELREMIGLPDVTDSNIATQSEKGQGGLPIHPEVKHVAKALDTIEKRIEEKKKRIEDLRYALYLRQEQLEEEKKARKKVPGIWPTTGEISSPFGLRWGGTDFHPGIDIADDIGTPIKATADGVVTFAGWHSGGYGYMVDIDHGNSMSTRYAHANEVTVSVGQFVKRGDIIAYMGNTGYSTGPHLHYEVHVDGEVVNPANYLP